MIVRFFNVLNESTTDKRIEKIISDNAKPCKEYLQYTVNNTPEDIQEQFRQLNRTLYNSCISNGSKVIDFLRLYVCKFFDINRGKGPVMYIEGIFRIAVGELKMLETVNTLSELEKLKLNVMFLYKSGNQDYDKNLNNLDYWGLISKTDTLRKEFNLKNRNLQKGKNLHENNYIVIPINSFREASKFSRYTEWCVTHDKFAFDEYTQTGERFYFCYLPGFKDIKEKAEANCPLDEYGMSLISVRVDMEGEPLTITTRWNHENDGENNENFKNAEQFQELTGIDFYKTFLPYTREELHAKGITSFDEIEEMVKQGTLPDIYYVYGKSENIIRVNNRYNYIKPDDTLAFHPWVNMIQKFDRNFFTPVQYHNDIYNFIDKTGKRLNDEDYKCVGSFSGGFARVRYHDGTYNFIDKTGKPLNNEKYREVYDFSEGFARVRYQDGTWNYIDKTGKCLNNERYENADYFYEGLARVRYQDGTWNYIDKTGKCLNNERYENADYFSEGFARVQYQDGTWNFIDKTGKRLNDEDYKYVYNFSEGIAMIEFLDGMYNFIDENGHLLNNEKYTDADDFYEGTATVEIDNYMVKRIDKNGKYVK